MANPKIRHCPKCDSLNVERVHYYGQWSFMCHDCMNWGPWRDVVLRASVGKGQ